MLALRLSGPLPAAACFCAYLLADLAAGLFLLPPLRLEMVLHHGLCLLLTAAGMAIMARGAPAERGIAADCTNTLLWMEGVNPFLHGLWLATKEPLFSGRVPRAAKGALAAALLGLYAWLRVLGCARVAAAVWLEHWAALGAGAPAYFSLVAALACLQVYWFGLIAWLVFKGLCAPGEADGEGGGGAGKSKSS